MRYDRRYPRVLAMITDPVIPRSRNGVLRLCHRCQRRIYFANGFLRLLAEYVKREANYQHFVRLNPSKA